MIPNFRNASTLRRLASADVDTLKRWIIAGEDPDNPGHPLGETAETDSWFDPGAVTTPDTTAPIGTVTINSGASTTDALSVTLGLTAAADTTQMKVSNAPDLAGASWEAFADTKAWSLSAGADGTRTVYVQFRDAAANESYVYQDTIDYDTGGLPTATISGTPSSPTNATTATLTVAGAGVTHYKYKLDGGAWGTETAVSTTIDLSSLAGGAHTVYVIGKNAGENWQLEANATTVSWTVDITAPVTSASPAGGTYTSEQDVTLTPNETATTYFTTDGSDPAYPVSGTTQTYTPPIHVGSTTTLKFRSRDTATNLEAVKTQTYTINLASNQAPSTPTGLSAGTLLSDGTGFTLSWSASSDPDGTVNHYRVFKDGVAYNNNVAGTSLAIVGQAVPSSTQWTVSAVDSLGAESSQSTGLTVALASLVTGIYSIPDNAAMAVRWTKSTNATGYSVRHGTTSGIYPNSVVVGDVATATVGSLTNGTLVYYQVGATNTVGTVWSIEYIETPAVPSWSEDFQSYAIDSNVPSTFTLTLGHASEFTIQADPEDPTNHVLRTVHTTGGADATGQIMASVGSHYGNSTIHIRVRAAQNSGGGACIGMVSKYANLSQEFVGMGSGGYWMNYTGSDFTNISSYNADKWYDVRFDMHVGSNNFDMYVDGVSLGTYSSVDTLSDYWDTLVISDQLAAVEENGTFYWDYIRIF